MPFGANRHPAAASARMPVEVSKNFRRSIMNPFTTKDQASDMRGYKVPEQYINPRAVKRREWSEFFAGLGFAFPRAADRPLDMNVQGPVKAGLGSRALRRVTRPRWGGGNPELRSASPYSYAVQSCAAFGGSMMFTVLLNDPPNWIGPCLIRS